MYDAGYVKGSAVLGLDGDDYIRWESVMSKSLGHCPACGKDADYEDGEFKRCHNWPHAHSPENVADMARPTDDERLRWEFLRHIYQKGYWSGTADRHQYSG